MLFKVIKQYKSSWWCYKVNATYILWMCKYLRTALTFSKCVVQIATDDPHSADEISLADNSSTWVGKTQDGQLSVAEGGDCAYQHYLPI